MGAFVRVLPVIPVVKPAAEAGNVRFPRVVIQMTVIVSSFQNNEGEKISIPYILIIG
jgi:hypothetical protein